MNKWWITSLGLVLLTQFAVFIVAFVGGIRWLDLVILYCLAVGALALFAVIVIFSGEKLGEWRKLPILYLFVLVLLAGVLLTKMFGPAFVSLCFSGGLFVIYLGSNGWLLYWWWFMHKLEKRNSADLSIIPTNDRKLN